MFNRFFVGRCALVFLISPWFLRQAVIKTCFALSQRLNIRYFNFWKLEAKTKRTEKNLDFCQTIPGVSVFVHEDLYRTSPAFLYVPLHQWFPGTRPHKKHGPKCGCICSLGKNWLQGCRGIWGAHGMFWLGFCQEVRLGWVGYNPDLGIPNNIKTMGVNITTNASLRA